MSVMENQTEQAARLKREETQQEALDAAAKKVTVPITIQVTGELLQGILCSAFEGGMMKHWCKRIYVARPPSRPVIFDADIVIFDGAIRVELFDEAHERASLKEVEGVETIHWITLASLAKGLDIIASEYPHHMADILKRNYDAVTGDVLVQCAVFGKIVYV